MARNLFYTVNVIRDGLSIGVVWSGLNSNIQKGTGYIIEKENGKEQGGTNWKALSDSKMGANVTVQL